MLRTPLLFLAAGVVSFGGPILTNLPGNDVLGTLFATASTIEAAEFTMGANTYTLNSIDLRLFTTGTVPAATYSASLWTDSGSGSPGALGVALGSQNLNSGSPATLNFLPVSSFQLLAGHSYWILVSGNSSSAEWLASSPGVLASNSQASMTAFDISLNSGATFGPTAIDNSYGVNATLVGTPEPSSWMLLGAGLMILLKKRVARV